MSPVSSFVSLLATFAPLMTPSSFENFQVLASGWVLSTRRRTVTELIQRAGAVDLRNFCTFHRFFNRARRAIGVRACAAAGSAPSGHSSRRR